MIEFRVFDNSPVELGECLEVWAKHSKRLVTNGRQAVEVWRGKRRERLLAQYGFEQRKQQKTTIQKVEPVPSPVVEAVEPIVIEMVDAPTLPVVIDEQAEAEEFAVAVAERQLYVPSPDEWFEARVASRNPKMLILELTTGDTVSCVPKFVTESPGNHVLCLPNGLVGSLRMELFQGRYRALEYRVDSEPSTLDETARVIMWKPDKNVGMAQRSCGCHLWIVSAHNDWIHGAIGVGDFIKYKLERSKTKSGWVGVRAQKIEAPRGEEK